MICNQNTIIMIMNINCRKVFWRVFAVMLFIVRIFFNRCKFNFICRLVISLALAAIVSPKID